MSGTERDVTLRDQEGAATIKVDVCQFSVKEVKGRKAILLVCGCVCRSRVEFPVQVFLQAFL